MSYDAISPNITKKIDIDETPIITPTEVGNWLNLSAAMVTMKTDLINMLINAAIEIVEQYSWLSLRRTTYEAYFNLPESYFYSFINGEFKLGLERSPILALADITKIEYLDTDGVYQEFDRGALTSEGLYENTTEIKEPRGWASIYFRESVPFDSTRINAYKIKVTFIAGFTIGTDITTDIPQAIKTALLMMIASDFTNRGDCSDCNCDLNGYPVPCGAKSKIDLYSISKTVLGGSYNPTKESDCYFGGC